MQWQVMFFFFYPPTNIEFTFAVATTSVFHLVTALWLVSSRWCSSFSSSSLHSKYCEYMDRSDKEYCLFFSHYNSWMKWFVCWPDQSPATSSGAQSSEALRASHLFLKCSEFPLFSLSFQPLPLLLLGSKPCFLWQADTKTWKPCQPRGAFYQQSVSQCDDRASRLPCSLSFLSSSSFFSCAFWALVSFLWRGKEKWRSVKHASVKEWQHMTV